MKKHDAMVLQAFQEHHGIVPEAYAYGIEGLSFWVTMLLAGGALGAIFQKPYMIALKGDQLYYIGTSMWKTSTLKPEMKKTLSRGEIKGAKNKKFGPANWMSIELTNGSKIHMVMSGLYPGLAKQKENVEKIKTFLGL